MATHVTGPQACGLGGGGRLATGDMPVFVFLHNYDCGPEDGQRFVELGRERIHHPLVQQLDCRFPEAPSTPSSTGRPVRLWYNLQTMHEGDDMYVLGEPVLILQRVAWLKGLIRGLEAQGTPASDVVLCGVRQGGSLLAAAVILLLEIQLGGVVMIGALMPAVETVQGWLEARGGAATLGNKNTPMLAIHGSNDAHMDQQLQRRLDLYFLGLGYHNYKAVEAMYLDSKQERATDGMWMFTWQFVLLVFDGNTS